MDTPDTDVFLSGLLFLDLAFTDLEHPPTPGREVWTGDMGTGPGGIANFAVALSRLGLRTSLAAAFGGGLRRATTAGTCSPAPSPSTCRGPGASPAGRPR